MKTRKMKDSGLIWVGDVPSNWQVIKNKYVLRKTKRICQKWKGEPVLSLSMKGVCPRDLDNPSGKMPTTFDGYQYVTTGNALMCLFDYDVTPRCIGRALLSGVTSPAYSCFDVLENATLDWIYYYYLMVDNGKEILHLARNLRHAFNEEDFGSIKMPLPPLTEQRAIASYLDDRCAKIDAMIGETKALIEEYKTWRQSLIFEAVTGKRPVSATATTKNAKDAKMRKGAMRDSGVECIGTIPYEWQIRRFKFLVTSLRKGNGITKDQVFENGEIPCVRYGEIYSRYGSSFTKCISRTNRTCLTDPVYFSTGDLLFACTGELVEEIGKNIVYVGNDRCVAGGDILVATHHQNPTYLNYYLNCHSSQYQKSRGKTKLKVVHARTSDIENLLVLLPSLPEQKQIADYLDAKCAVIDRVVAEKEALIADLEQYRKSLIFECVTGKRVVA